MWYAIVIFFVKVFYKVAFRAKAFGREKLPKEGGFILAANHKSNFDPPFVVVFARGKQFILAKEELFQNKLAGWFLKSVGASKIRRGSNDITVMKKAIGHLRGGGSLLLFPQGGRRKSIEVENVKDGVALLATRAKVPVVPVGIVGDYKLFRRMKVTFGEPIRLDEYYGRKLSPEELRGISERVLREISEIVDKG